MAAVATIDSLEKECSAESWFLMRMHSELDFPIFEFQACIEPWTFINLRVDASAFNHDGRPSKWQSVEDTIRSVLSLCRSHFATTPPKFWHKIQVRLTTSDIWPEEVPFIQDFSVLPRVEDLKARTPDLDQVPVIHLDDLETIRDRGHFLPAGVRIVRYEGHAYIAKGPVYPLHLDHFATELDNLAALPLHPHIISPPTALVSPDDHMTYACGFLMPFYPKGNLDRYSQMRHAAGDLTLGEILRWFRQAAATLQYLSENGTWHGDLKPDNILVMEDGGICLTDMTRTMATSVTASPEVRAYCNRRAPQGNVLLGVPSAWSIDAIVLSEIYSLGRTIFMIMTAQSMMDVYEQYGWVSNHKFINSFCDQADCRSLFSSHAESVKATKELVLSCLQRKPTDRPSMDCLLTSIEEIEQRWETQDVILRAAKNTLYPAL